MHDNSEDWLGQGGALLNMWTDMAAKMMGASLGGGAAAPVENPPEALRELRSGILAAWTRYCDQFMRSPQFLDSLRQAMNANIQARRQMNEALGKVQHDLQGVSRQDLDQMMRTLQHLEQGIATGVERISQRLDELNARVDDMDRDLFEDDQEPAEPAAPPRSRRRRRRPAS